MDRQEDLDYSRQGLLKENSIPLRPSVDQAFRSSSELGDDYNELQFDQDHETKFRNGKRWPWVAKFRRIISGGGPAYEGERRHVERPSRRSKIRACCWRRRICLIVTGILLTGVIILLSGSALWIYKTAPEDGVCYDRHSASALCTDKCVAVTSMVSSPARRYSLKLGKELSQSRSDGGADDPH